MNLSTYQGLSRASFLGFLVFCLGFGLPAVWGAPKIEVRAAQNLSTNYTKLYLAPIRHDVRKVYPRLLARLQKSPFEVIELKAENLAFASQGSGFVISPEGLVLTCAHVVGPEPKATLWIQGSRYLGRVLAIDTNLDAAVIRVEGEHSAFPAITWSTNMEFHMGQDVLTLGFPMADVLGTKPRLNKGLVSSTVGLHDEPHHIQISAEIQPGNSGGPALNAQGQVIGMVDTTLNSMYALVATGGSLPQNVNFAIKGNLLLEFLRAAKIGIPSSEPPTNVDFEAGSKCLVLVRGGVVTEERLRERPLVCVCRYLMEDRRSFRFLGLTFIDVSRLHTVLQAVETRPTFTSEDASLDALLEQVCERFFPGHDNPFASKHAKRRP